MIFFNIPEARECLMNKMEVYTLRKSRSEGVHLAAKGSIYNGILIFKVTVTKIATIKRPEELSPYLDYSGFDNVYDWFSKASFNADTLYLVKKLEV